MMTLPGRSGSDRPFVLHIGLPKTGTSTLQRHLFPRHTGIEYLGKFDADRSRNRWNHCRDKAVQRITSEIFFDRWANPDFDLCRRLFEDSIRPTLESGKPHLLSWEGLTLAPLDRQRIRSGNFLRVFGPSKIMLTIRHPVTSAESGYFQYLTDEFTGHSANWKKRPKYVAPERFMERLLLPDHGRPDHGRLLYSESAEIHCELFGRDAIEVFVFEEFVENPQRFVRRLCAFLGIDPEEGVALARDKHENPRWTEEHIRRLREMGRSLLGSIRFQLAGRERRRTLLGFEPGDSAWEAPAARFEVPDSARRKIEERTREGNRWLAQEWGLPLERYGYPL